MFPPVHSIPKSVAEDTTITISNSSGERTTIILPQGSSISMHTPALHYNRRLPVHVCICGSLELMIIGTRSPLLERSTHFQPEAVPRPGLASRSLHAVQCRPARLPRPTVLRNGVCSNDNDDCAALQDQHQGGAPVCTRDI